MELATLDPADEALPLDVTEPEATQDFTSDIARGLRQPKDRRAVGRERVASGSGGSWWMGKSRADLAAEAEARAHDMSRTAIGRTVRGTVNLP